MSLEQRVRAYAFGKGLSRYLNVQAAAKQYRKTSMLALRSSSCLFEARWQAFLDIRYIVKLHALTCHGAHAVEGSAEPAQQTCCLLSAVTD